MVCSARDLNQTIFVQKALLLVQAFSLLAKPWLRFWSHSHLKTDFSSDYTGRIRNELNNAARLICSFFKIEYKIVAIKYQFSCAKVQFIL